MRFSDASQSKRRRTAGSSAWDVESEQEEHSLSLSQISSPSQSDHEQTPVAKAASNTRDSAGFHLFKQLNQIRGNESSSLNALNCQNEFRKFTGRTPPGSRYEPRQMMHPEIWPVQNLVTSSRFAYEQFYENPTFLLECLLVLCFSM